MKECQTDTHGSCEDSSPTWTVTKWTPPKNEHMWRTLKYLLWGFAVVAMSVAAVLALLYVKG